MVEAADKNLGWIFGWQHEGNEIGDERNLRLKEDSALLYETLEKIMSVYYRTISNGSVAPPSDLPAKSGPIAAQSLKSGGGVDPYSDWITKMIYAIAGAGFFNTDRMIAEYEKKIWEL